MGFEIPTVTHWLCLVLWEPRPTPNKQGGGEPGDVESQARKRQWEMEK